MDKPIKISMSTYSNTNNIIIIHILVKLLFCNNIHKFVQISIISRNQMS